MTARAPSSRRAHKNRLRAAGRSPPQFVAASPRPRRGGCALPAAAGDKGGRSRCAGLYSRLHRGRANNPLRISEGEKHLREVEGIRQIRPFPFQYFRNGPRSARSTRLEWSRSSCACGGVARGDPLGQIEDTGYYLHRTTHVIPWVLRGYYGGGAFNSSQRVADGSLVQEVTSVMVQEVISLREERMER